MIINCDKLSGLNKTQFQFSTARQIYHLNVTMCSFHKTEGLLSIQSYTILSIIEGPLRPAGGGLYCSVCAIAVKSFRRRLRGFRPQFEILSSNICGNKWEKRN